MCIEYIFNCTACNYSWELYGDGLFVVDLRKLDVRCSKCGCQVLIVTDTNAPNKTPEHIDFTEQNMALATSTENSFNEIKAAFEKLSLLVEGSSEYNEIKSWLLKRIK